MMTSEPQTVASHVSSPRFPHQNTSFEGPAVRLGLHPAEGPRWFFELLTLFEGVHVKRSVGLWKFGWEYGWGPHDQNFQNPVMRWRLQQLRATLTLKDCFNHNRLHWLSGGHLIKVWRPPSSPPPSRVKQRTSLTLSFVRPRAPQNPHKGQKLKPEKSSYLFSSTKAQRNSCLENRAGTHPPAQQSPHPPVRLSTAMRFPPDVSGKVKKGWGTGRWGCGWDLFTCKWSQGASTNPREEYESAPTGSFTERSHTDDTEPLCHCFQSLQNN